MSFFSNTWINGASKQQVVLRAGGGTPPPLDERYFTELDGQSKYWRRIEPDYGQTTTATIECLFYGGSSSGLQYLVGRHSSDSFYLALNGSDVFYGNGSSALQGATAVTLTKINHAKLTADGTNVTFYVNGVQVAQTAQTWTGLLDDVGFGVRGELQQDFYDGILVSARVATDTVDNVYPLDKNLPYELADGTALGPELWAGQNYTQANNSTVSTIVSGSEWSVQSGAGGAANFANGARVSSFATVIGKTYQYSVTSGEPVNVAVYRPDFSNVSKGTGFLVFTAQDTVSQLYVAPRTTNTVTFSNPTIREVPDSALIFENGEVDGSDRLLVTEKQDGSGFLGADLWYDGTKTITGNATAPTDDSITINETGAALAAVGITAPVGPITVTGDCELISGQVDLSVIPGFSGVAASITESGTFSFDLESQGAVGFKRAFIGGAVANITNIKVDVRYDYASGASPSTNPYSNEYSNEYS